MGAAGAATALAGVVEVEARGGRAAPAVPDDAPETIAGALGARPTFCSGLRHDEPLGSNCHDGLLNDPSLALQRVQYGVLAKSCQLLRL